MNYNKKCFTEYEMRAKTLIYQSTYAIKLINVTTLNMYLTWIAYLKRVLNRKVKVRINRSKSWKYRLNLQNILGNSVKWFDIFIDFKFFNGFFDTWVK